MDSVERCELTELITTQCAHCRPAPPTFREPLFTPPGGDNGEIVATFAARFGGRCDLCDGVFEVGDSISRTAEAEYVCTDCAMDLRR